jgi:hypothetical protein
LSEHAVDPVAYGDAFLLGFDMNVAGVPGDALCENEIDEAHDWPFRGVLSRDREFFDVMLVDLGDECPFSHSLDELVDDVLWSIELVEFFGDGIGAC